MLTDYCYCNTTNHRFKNIDSDILYAKIKKKQAEVFF